MADWIKEVVIPSFIFAVPLGIIYGVAIYGTDKMIFRIDLVEAIE